MSIAARKARAEALTAHRHLQDVLADPAATAEDRRAEVARTVSRCSFAPGVPMRVHCAYKEAMNLLAGLAGDRSLTSLQSQMATDMGYAASEMLTGVLWNPRTALRARYLAPRRVRRMSASVSRFAHPRGPELTEPFDACEGAP